MGHFATCWRFAVGALSDDARGKGGGVRFSLEPLVSASIGLAHTKHLTLVPRAESSNIMYLPHSGYGHCMMKGIVLDCLYWSDNR